MALVGAFSVIVKTGYGTDRALHSTSFICNMLDIHQIGRVESIVWCHGASGGHRQWSCAMINQQWIVNYHYLRLLTIRTLYLVLKTLDRLQQAPAVISITLNTKFI